jgi:hypothetical protein
LYCHGLGRNFLVQIDWFVRHGARVSTLCRLKVLRINGHHLDRGCSIIVATRVGRKRQSIHELFVRHEPIVTQSSIDPFNRKGLLKTTVLLRVRAIIG